MNITEQEEKAMTNIVLGSQIMLRPADIVVDKNANPRKHFEREALSTLAKSIKAQGVLQPLVVYKDQLDGGKYHLIAGERRLRAAKSLKLATIPVILKLIRMTKEDDGDIAEMRFSENSQRVQLTPLEDARSFQQILGHKVTYRGKRVVATAKVIAEKYDKSTGWVSQRLSLLDLPLVIVNALDQGEIPFSCGRELTGLRNAEQQLKYYRQIKKNGGSKVAEVKRMLEKHRVQKKNDETSDTPKRGRPANEDRDPDAPDVAKQGLETALERLRGISISFRKKSEVREAIATVYERYERARTDEKKIFMKGMMTALEWVVNVRESF